MTNRSQPKPKPRGRPIKYDWDSIRRAYISGGADVTYQALSAENSGPSYDRIKARAAAENWTGLRADFRHLVKTKIKEMEMDAIEVVRARHAHIGKTLQLFGMEVLEQIDPATVTLTGAVRLILAGCEIERKALELEERSVNLNDIYTPADLSKLSVEQLLELRQRRHKALGSHIVN